MQVRLAAPYTSEQYVTGQLWQLARLTYCPWHRQGGCGLTQNGSYHRVKPTGRRSNLNRATPSSIFIAPESGRTITWANLVRTAGFFDTG
jgi:hypothetical protein